MESAGNSRSPNFDEIESYIEKVRDVVNLNHSGVSVVLCNW